MKIKCLGWTVRDGDVLDSTEKFGFRSTGFRCSLKVDFSPTPSRCLTNQTLKGTLQTDKLIQQKKCKHKSRTKG